MFTTTALTNTHTSHPILILTNIILDDTSLHSTIYLPISSLTNNATPSLPLPSSTPDTLPITLPKLTSPFPFIFVSLNANTSIILLTNMLPISPLFSSLVPQPRTYTHTHAHTHKN